MNRWSNIPETVWPYTIPNPPLTILFSGVYLLGKNNTVVYVGKAKNIHARLASHLTDVLLPKSYNQVRFIPVLIGKHRFKTVEERNLAAADELERLLIWWLKPEQNRFVRQGGISSDIPYASQFLGIMNRLHVEKMLQEIHQYIP
jgi:hypothetical protein